MQKCNMENIKEFIRSQFNTSEFIPLHAPIFIGNEKKYVMETIDSTIVSSVGKFVDKFEEVIKEYTGAKYAIATVNGTSALHLSLLLAGVKHNDLVITQPLSFIATCCTSTIYTWDLATEHNMLGNKGKSYSKRGTGGSTKSTLSL